MKNQPLVKKLHKPVHPALSKPILAVALLVSVALLLAMLQIQYGIFSSKSAVPPTPTIAPVRAMPTQQAYMSPTPNPDCASQTFSSSDLGINFNYLYPNCTQKFFTREIGNIVYLYTRGDEPFSGTDADFLKTFLPNSHYYYAEVFNKDPNLSLKDAIRQQILKGYPEDICVLKDSKHAYPREDSSYSAAEIDVSYTVSATQSPLEQRDAMAAKCPSYSTIFFPNYFLMNPKHPNKYLFIKLGQDNIPAGVKGYTWDGTIKILQ